MKPITGDVTGPGRGSEGPYFQSQRKENYQRRVEALLSRGLAYEQEGAVKFKMVTWRCANSVRDLEKKQPKV